MMIHGLSIFWLTQLLKIWLYDMVKKSASMTTYNARTRNKHHTNFDNLFIFMI